MDFTDTLFELIDMRSFSNLWYWIALAVMWSVASHRVLGVPQDMIHRARQGGGQAAADVDTLAAVNIRRIGMATRTGGAWLLALASFGLTVLALLGFVYEVEFAQAVFLMALPMSLVGAMTVRAARRIEAEGARGAALRGRLRRHRVQVQLIGMASIFVTAVWGMYQNLSIGALAS